MTGRGGLLAPLRRIAPPRFVLFCAVMLGAAGLALLAGSAAGPALVIGFDLGATVFALSLLPLAREHGAAQMRVHAAQNDANRGMVLAITALVALAVLAAIGTELPAARGGSVGAIVALVATLGLSWGFTNLVFMLHYAHMHYLPDAAGAHRGGFAFPGTRAPGYWDFLYFAFTAGMSFAASDVDVTRTDVRRVVVLHSLLSFVFNIGVLAFSINVLAGAAS